MAVQQDAALSWLIAVAVPTLLVIAGFIISRMVPLFREYQGKLDGVNARHARAAHRCARRPRVRA